MVDPKDLRETAEAVPHDVYSWLHPKLMDAADEIERLRSALKTISEMKTEDFYVADGCDYNNMAEWVALEALGVNGQSTNTQPDDPTR